MIRYSRYLGKYMCVLHQNATYQIVSFAFELAMILRLVVKNLNLDYYDSFLLFKG